MAAMAKVPTKFMISLHTDLVEKNLANSTVSDYLARLVRINNGNVFNNLGFLKQKDSVMEWLSQYEDSSRSKYLSAIVTCLTALGISTQHLYKTTYQFYKVKLDECLGKLDEIDPHIKTPKEQENFVSWDEVIAKREVLKNKVDLFKGDKNLDLENFQTLVQYLILCLYSMIPPRRNKDFQNMRIILKGSTEGLPTESNYLDLSEGQFIFNQYKTQKFYGSQTEDIPEDLMEVIMIWLKHHPALVGRNAKPKDIPLFISYNGGQEVLVNYVTLRLNRIFKPKKVSTCILRHAYINHKLGNVFAEEESHMAEREELAEEMGHSVDMQHRYWKK